MELTQYNRITVDQDQTSDKNKQKYTLEQLAATLHTVKPNRTTH